MAGRPATALPAGFPDRRALSRRSLLTASLVGLAGAAGCSSRAKPTDMTDLPAGPDLLVGVCLEATGTGAVLGLSAQRGLNVAVDGLNSTGIAVGNQRRQVRLIIRDTVSDAVTAAAAMEELVVSEQVCAVIGGATVQTSVAMSPVAEKYQVSMLSLASADSITKPVPQHRYAFKLGPDASKVADLIITQLGRLGATSIAIFAEASPHGDAGLEAMLMATAAASIPVVYKARLVPGATAVDYQKHAQSAVDAKVHATVIWAVAPNSVATANALRTVGYTGYLLFDTGAAADDVLTGQNRPTTTGGYFVAPQIMGDSPKSVITPIDVIRRDFFDSYTRRYGSLSGYAIFAADALRLVATAAERAKDPTRLRLRNSMEAAPMFGVGGSYTFSTINHGGVETDQLAMFELTADGWSQQA